MRRVYLRDAKEAVVRNGRVYVLSPEPSRPEMLLLDVGSAETTNWLRRDCELPVDAIVKEAAQVELEESEVRREANY